VTDRLTLLLAVGRDLQTDIDMGRNSYVHAGLQLNLPGRYSFQPLRAPNRSIP
jgi:hypothetical protein